MKSANRDLKQKVRQFKRELVDEFYQSLNVTQVTHKLVSFIDETLIKLFQINELDESGQFCLLAIGSYGRRELQLHSDIDLLLLHTADTNNKDLHKAQLFIQSCWDIGLEISHQLTTVNACAELARKDLSVISSILDIKTICGRNNLMEELQYQTHPIHMWPSHEFYAAKVKEQKKRYKKYNETAYNLEPSVKHGPGGLRDLQVIISIGKRHFGIKKLADCIKFGFITPKEYEEFTHCLQFLWRVRFALHSIAKKNEERLLFDFQVKLAKLFNYEDDEHALAIEHFMKTYFKVIKKARELNEILLQWFNESIVNPKKKIITPLDNWFQLANQHLEIRRANVFSERPIALMELFLWIAQFPVIEGIKANTLRSIHEHLYLINKKFKASSAARKLFIKILTTTNDPYKIFRLMSRFGILGRYVEPFAKIIGQMQYDLFHVYTVDQHTLFVIRNLQRFIDSKYSEQFPLCEKVMKNIKQREVLYLAALFHDIAKGRGGDHSTLGAIDASKFASNHNFPLDNKKLLIWLVENHLVMSHTAQRQDIYDPKTISNFCKQLPKPYYLDYIYLLTVADTCATNPSLWNSWKDTLLRELYLAAYDLMQQEKTLLDEKNIIAYRKQSALKTLMNEGADKQKVEELWSKLKGLYFLHESSDAIARQTKAIISCGTFPLVMIMPHHNLGATEVLIYMPHKNERVTITTTILSNNNLSILEASILTSKSNYDLDKYIILDENNKAFISENRTNKIKHDLMQGLTHKDKLPNIYKKRLSRTFAHFKRKPKISFSHDLKRKQTSLFLITEDKPGLLANISLTFLMQKITLINAKITTAGERVEDMFYIENQYGERLTDKEMQELESALLLLLKKDV